jgi:hypothetical protein
MQMDYLRLIKSEAFHTFCKNWFVMTVAFFYVCYFLGFRKRKGQLFLMKVGKSIDRAFVNHLKWQTHTNLFRNNYIDLVTGRSLVWLLGFE